MMLWGHSLISFSVHDNSYWQICLHGLSFSNLPISKNIIISTTHSCRILNFPQFSLWEIYWLSFIGLSTFLLWKLVAITSHLFCSWSHKSVLPISPSWHLLAKHQTALVLILYTNYIQYWIFWSVKNSKHCALPEVHWWVLPAGFHFTNNSQ